MGIIPALCFLLLCNNILAQEDCHKACSGHFEDGPKKQGCKDGCLMGTAFVILYPQETNIVRTKCEGGCDKTYEDTEMKEACIFGCQNVRGTGSGTVTLTEKDPIIGVVQKELNEKMRFSLFNFLPSFFHGADHGIEETMNRMKAYQEELSRWFEARRSPFLRPSFTDNDDFASHRPQGHLADSFKGPSVGNSDINGAEIVNVKPVKQHQKIFLKVYTSPDHYEAERMQRPADQSSFVERLSQRARRMSILSQWLICIALLLCLLSMLGISLAIIRQIKLQQRLRVRQTHVVIPPALGQPLPAKKIPLESPSAAMDYPLIHDTPPPAYDQLSVHKEKLQDPQQP